MSSLKSSLIALCGAGLFSLGVWVGGLPLVRTRAVKAPAAAACTDGAGTLPATASTRPEPTATAKARPFLVRPVDLFVAKDKEAEAVYRKSQSHELVDLVRRNVARFEAMTPPGMPAEAAANAVMPYVTGWVDSVMRTAPDLLDELSAEVERTACDQSASLTQRVVMYRVATMYPDVATPSAFGCVLEHAPEEDLLLWSALDAYRVSGLPKSDALRALEQSAKDPRTVERLRTPAETVERFRELETRGALPGSDEVAIAASGARPPVEQAEPSVP